MTLRAALLTFPALFCLAAPTARANNIAYFTASVTPANASAELGRPSRSGTQQTWTNAESYTGKINSATAYYYTTYTFNGAAFFGGGFVEVSAFDASGLGYSFLSAYASSFDPGNQGANWLGDEGGSGNYFGLTDGRFFDVFLPQGENLVLVLNTTPGGTLGLNNAIDVSVDNYSTPDYAAPTPEPATLVTVATGLLGLGEAARRRRSPA